VSTLHILGTRGIPASHGGFETFAEKLALYLVARGWDVHVYCQAAQTDSFAIEMWRGIRLIRLPASASSLGTMLFDARALLHVRKRPGVVLTLGYNTAIFNALLGRRGIRRHVMNMDGIEWRRKKWGIFARLWLRANETIGGYLAAELVADHPEVARRLAALNSRTAITMIPYGAEILARQSSDAATLEQLALDSGGYALVVARPEPENSILEIVSAWSSRRRDLKLVVLGDYTADNAYASRVKAAASEEVVFPGAIYNPASVQALRAHAKLYIHGHTVGGTNPSLVEAMGAGNAVLAHDNPFNRWVARDGARYFAGTVQCAQQLDQLLQDDALLERLAAHARDRCARRFQWQAVLEEYADLLQRIADLPA